jgi:hypothetical protein
MVGDKDCRRRTTGHVFTIGGTILSWISKLQNVIALLTIGVVYVVATKDNK